ncbi:MAG: pentapeptide repeat-containing protein [Ignavibacteriaceae bacterium]|nr:pentapeptide repeat-containing protein [Ignavibacteriaceae bacterium]
MNYTEGKTFRKEDFSSVGFIQGEYENCIFEDCDFSGADLSASLFIDCEFRGCNLTLLKLYDTVFRDVGFTDCKMQGLQFGQCSGFGLSFSFSRCDLSFCSFHKLKIPGTVFKECHLKEADFSLTDLKGADFSGSDLISARFEQTNLEKADFSDAVNFIIDPAINKIKKARFSASGLAGLLSSYDIVIK